MQKQIVELLKPFTMPNQYVETNHKCPVCGKPAREKVEFSERPRSSPISFGGRACRVFYDAKSGGTFCSDTKKCGIKIDRPTVLTPRRLKTMEDKFNE